MGAGECRLPCGTLVYRMIILFVFIGSGIFSSRPQNAILRTGILGQIASFERCLRRAAQTPLALPYPFRTWPGSGTWAKRDKREVCKFLYFGRHVPELFLDLGILQSLNEKVYGKTCISKLASFPNWLLISSPPHFFHGRTSKRSHRTTLCRCFSISDFKLEYLCSSVRCLRGGPFPTQRHHYTQCPC